MAIERKLSAEVQKRLDSLSQHVKDSLENIDKRSKETQMYVLRNSAVPQQAVKETVTPPVDSL